MEFEERIFQLEKELQQANEKLNLIGQVQRKGGFIYHEEEPEPCCAHCFDTDRILIRIVEKYDPVSPSGSIPCCPHYKTAFYYAYPQGIRGRLEAS